MSMTSKLKTERQNTGISDNIDIVDILSLAKIPIFPQECVSAVQGHSRSLIFVRIESAYSLPILLCHSNLGPP